MVVSEAVPVSPTVWEGILPYLRRLDARRCDCAPDEVLEALEKPTATLHWVLDDEGRPRGFLVLTTCPETGALFIWVGVMFSGHDPLLILTTESLDSLARRYGFTEIRFRSSRPGWLKQARDAGFRPVETVYSRRV